MAPKYRPRTPMYKIKGLPYTGAVSTSSLVKYYWMLSKAF